MCVCMRPRTCASQCVLAYVHMYIRLSPTSKVPTIGSIFTVMMSSATLVTLCDRVHTRKVQRWVGRAFTHIAAALTRTVFCLREKTSMCDKTHNRRWRSHLCRNPGELPRPRNENFRILHGSLKACTHSRSGPSSLTQCQRSSDLGLGQSRRTQALVAPHPAPKNAVGRVVERTVSSIAKCVTRR